MRLLQKTNYYYLVIAGALFTLAGIILYLTLKKTVDAEIDEKLTVNAQRVIKMIETGDSLPNLPPLVETIIPDEPLPAGTILKDTLIYDPVENEMELFREFRSAEVINGEPLLIIVRQSKLESHDIYGSIIWVLVLVLLLLLVILYFANRLISRHIWKPFFNNLQTLKKFSIQSETALALQPSSIREFEELNDTLHQLTDKLLSDYKALKKFTENAAHELQTPLALIQSALETMMQDQKLNDDLAAELEKAFNATRRLSAIHRNLTLLTGIENNQFTDIETIDLSSLIREMAGMYQAMAGGASLSIQMDIGDQVQLRASRFLVETMVGNLFSNAIRHNYPHGKIIITLDDRSLEVSNTGAPLPWPEKRLFERFASGPADGHSHGLGLAIVYSICKINQWTIDYSWAEPVHHFRIGW